MELISCFLYGMNDFFICDKQLNILQFFSEQLKYIADKDSAQKYLSEVHAKFIPMPNANKEESDADEEDSGKS